MSYAEQFDFLTFDCYGTLIDWESGILEALRPLIASHGVKLDDVHILTWYAELESKIEKGEYRPYREILAEVVRGFGRKFGFKPSADDEACLANSLGRWRPFDDTVESLQALGRKFNLVVISNVDDDLFAATRETLGVDLHAVITAQQARAYKPSKRVFQQALMQFGCPASRVMHVAQSMYHDVNVAHSLGITTVWVNRRIAKKGSGATLPAAGQADFVVPNLRALTAILL
ncbi:MAG: haloacid dehalogenase type II [Deltaproteobacteria bacterium]|nr:haloacid dehalogenase type II [Deltaproteobacteria bacterium]